MKKTMIAVWAAATSLVLAAGIVEETKSQPVLAGSPQIAPFGTSKLILSSVKPS